MAKNKINTIFNLLERKRKKRLREKPFTDEWFEYVDSSKRRKKKR